MTVRLVPRYDRHADRFFWLRGSFDGSAVDKFRERVATIYADLPRWADIALDPILAGQPTEDLRVEDLATEAYGLPLRDRARQLVDVMADAPFPPEGRRLVVEDRIASLRWPEIEAAAQWSADRLGLAPLAEPVDIVLVADGVPLGGVSGETADGRAVSFVAVVPHGGTTLVEVIVHEAMHVMDMADETETSTVGRLRLEADAHPQLWHAPIFLYAAEAVRRHLEPDHVDFGTTHGYYAKVPAVLASLQARGIPDC